MGDESLHSERLVTNRPHCSSDLCNLEPEPMAQNLVSTRYRVWLAGMIREVCLTWYRGILGNGFLIRVASKNEQSVCRCKVDISYFIFWKKQRKKSFMVDGVNVEVVWNCSNAKYSSGPEPYADYYVVLICQGEIVFHAGDLKKDAVKRLKASPCDAPIEMVAKREHVFGKRVCESRARFVPEGKEHQISVECWRPRGGRVPGLRIRIDGILHLEVKHLMWHFRGNKTILVDGVGIDVFWDAYNWLFDGINGYAVFMFEVSKAIEKWPHGFPEFGDEAMEEEKCIYPLPSWGGIDRRVYAKDWLRNDSISFTGAEEFNASSEFSLILISWRHDLKSNYSQ